MQPSNLRLINEAKADKAQSLQRHQDLVKGLSQVSNTAVETTTSLIKYLEGKTTKTQVVNQLKSIGTPDALKVIPEIKALHETLKLHKNTDLTEVTKVMQGILDEAKKIPKELPKAEKQQFVDYTKQFSALSDAVKAVEKVVKNQELVVHPPVVNVPETKVNVEAPDLKPLQKDIKDVVRAVTKIVIPEFKTDNEEVEKLLKQSNKLLKDIVEKPISKGGGGGGRATPYEDAAGIPKFPRAIDSTDTPGVTGIVVLNPDGSNISGGGSSGAATERYDYASSATIYAGSAPVGTADNVTGWAIYKYDLSDSSDASGKLATDVSWDNRATGTYQ